METFKMDWGVPALLSLVGQYDFQTVLDVGSGAGEHKRLLEYVGKTVTTVDFENADYSGDFMEIDIPEQFDVVWCSHVIEHQRNVGLFLERLRQLIKPDGVLAIVAPLHPKERLVAGHVTGWSIYLLFYNLILAGFDCRDARALSLYELSAIIPRRLCQQNPKWRNSVVGDPGDDPIASIREYFPLHVDHGAELKQPGGIRWTWADKMPKPLTVICRHFPEPLVFEAAQ